MNFERFVGFRYLMAKRQRNVLSVITLISVAGVAVGVMALIVVLSVMGGFEGDLREKIIGAKAHIVVTGQEGALLENYDELVARIESVEGVVGASAYVEGEVMVNSTSNLQGVVLRGIDPVGVKRVSTLADTLEEGSLSYLDDPNQLPADAGLTLKHEPSGEGSGLTAPDSRDRRAAGARGTLAFVGSEHARFVNKELGEAEPEERADPDADTPLPPDLDRDAPPPPTPVAGDDKAPAGEHDGGSGKEGDDRPDGDDDLGGLDDSDDTWVVGGPSETESDDGLDDGDDTWAGDAPTLEGLPVVDDGEGLDDSEDTWSGEDGGLDDGEDVAGDSSFFMKPIQYDAERRLGGLVIGKELQSNLAVFLGNEVNIMSPMGDIGPTGSIPKSRPYRVVGVFYSGMYEFDTKYVYTTLDSAQRFLNLGNRVTGIEIKVEDMDASGEVKAALLEELSDQEGLLIRDWRELNGNLFAALLLEKIAMFVILTFIILVASFSILCLLIMIVIEKGREIAIFKAMGANTGSIMRMFMIQGGVIGVAGTAIGCTIGLALCWVISGWGIELPADVYYLSQVPVEVRPFEVITICASAVGISLLATLPPSILAARLDPVVGLRYE